MKDYIIIKLNGKQYKVYKGDEILIPGTFNEKASCQVLLKAKEGKLNIGKPYLKGENCKFKVLDKNLKGEKITVMKYKAKSRYRKKIGFRAIFTKLLVDKID